MPKQTAKREFPPLEQEQRPAVPTSAAAFYLNRAQRTLRGWATDAEAGPIQPRRINGRLAWPVAEIKRAIGVA